MRSSGSDLPEWGDAFTKKQPLQRYYRGESMRGTFRNGDVLTLAEVSLGELRVGDVVAYLRPTSEGKSEEVVHRIVAVAEHGLIARGDSNPGVDGAFVTEQNLVGRVIRAQHGIHVRHLDRGVRARVRAILLHTLVRVRVSPGRPARVIRGLYSGLRRSGLLVRVLRPDVLRVRVATSQGPAIKYLWRRRTVATWWPGSGRVRTSFPLDLLAPDLATGSPRYAQRGPEVAACPRSSPEAGESLGSYTE